ncbi:unnamed protein product, partial [Mesorhabditis belari]|uniref:Lipid-binding serum glycoprotein C-terminal domain-containing protein n=1 Tax=Mesorhabditis belari TaxID=2138241 RepID=A0AAF3E7Z7_9BILA
MGSFHRTIGIFSCFLTLCKGQDMSPILTSDATFIGSPGVRARLTLTGVTNVARIVAKNLAPEIAQADAFVLMAPHKLSQFSLSASSPKLRLFGDVNQVVVNMVPIGAITTHITNINASIAFTVNGAMNGRTIAGSIDLFSEGFAVDVTLNVKRNSRGNPLITILSCHGVAPKKAITVRSTSVKAPALQQLQSTAATWVPSLFEAVVCPRLEFIVEHRVNQRFALLPSKITLQQTANFDLMRAMIEADREIRRKARQNRRHRRDTGTGSLQAFISSNFNLSRAEGLVLDYGVLSSPIISSRGIEIESSGEISAFGVQTPFGPKPISLPATVSNEMFEIVVSDFVPNSFMYHGHRIGIFNTRVDPKTPHFGPTMRTSCDLDSGSLFCVGDLFPTLRDEFPDRELVFLFSTLRAPVVVVHSEKDGGIKFELLGLIQVMQIDPITKRETPLGSMEIELDAKMQMRITSKVVKGKVILDNITLRTRTPKVLVQEELDDASLLSREILQRMVNDIIRQGVPIPVHPLFRLRKPNLRLSERSLILETAFTLNKRLISQLTAAQLSRA